MNKIIIDPHYCTLEEYQDLKNYLDKECWDYREITKKQYVKPITIYKIALIVSKYYKIPYKHLWKLNDNKKRNREQKYVKPRQVIMYIAEQHRINKDSIIDFLKQDRNTIRCGLLRIKGLLETDKNLQIEINEIKQLIN